MISHIKQQYKMQCSLAMALKIFHTWQVTVPTSDLHNQNICESIKNVQRKATTIIQVLGNKTFEKGQKIGDYSG